MSNDSIDPNSLPPELAQQMANLMEMFGPEDLNADLAPHVTTASGITMLHHPLVIEAMYSPMRNKWINAYYAQKLASLKRARDEGDWSSFVFVHERPYRVDALVEALDEGLSGEEAWDIIGSVWTDTENVQEMFDHWIRIWTSGIPGRERAMTEEERADFNAMPDTIEVWRGVSHKQAAKGLSWTTDRSKAVWFAGRAKAINGGTGRYLVSGTVSKSDVLAYFTGRGESEIVVLPEKVRIAKTKIL